MFTFTIVLKIVLSALLGYVTLNSFFRFHFSIERFDLLFLVIFMGVVIAYLNTDKIIEFIWTVLIVGVAYLAVRLFTRHRKVSGYFLFNIYANDYGRVRADLLKAAEKHEVDSHTICYRRNRPFLVTVKKAEPKKVRALFKTLDDIYTHENKRFTMYNYWFIIAFLTLMVILWRF